MNSDRSQVEESKPSTSRGDAGAQPAQGSSTKERLLKFFNLPQDRPSVSLFGGRLLSCKKKQSKEKEIVVVFDGDCHISTTADGKLRLRYNEKAEEKEENSTSSEGNSESNDTSDGSTMKSASSSMTTDKPVSERVHLFTPHAQPSLSTPRQSPATCILTPSDQKVEFSAGSRKPESTSAPPGVVKFEGIGSTVCGNFEPSEMKSFNMAEGAKPVSNIAEAVANSSNGEMDFVRVAGGTMPVTDMAGPNTNPSHSDNTSQMESAKTMGGVVPVTNMAIHISNPSDGDRTSEMESARTAGCLMPVINIAEGSVNFSDGDRTSEMESARTAGCLMPVINMTEGSVNLSNRERTSEMESARTAGCLTPVITMTEGSVSFSDGDRTSKMESARTAGCLMPVINMAEGSVNLSDGDRTSEMESARTAGCLMPVINMAEGSVNLSNGDRTSEMESARTAGCLMPVINMTGGSVNLSDGDRTSEMESARTAGCLMPVINMTEGSVNLSDGDRTSEMESARTAGCLMPVIDMTEGSPNLSDGDRTSRMESARITGSATTITSLADVNLDSNDSNSESGSTDRTHIIGQASYLAPMVAASDDDEQTVSGLDTANTPLISIRTADSENDDISEYGTVINISTESDMSVYSTASLEEPERFQVPVGGAEYGESTMNNTSSDGTTSFASMSVSLPIGRLSTAASTDMTIRNEPIASTSTGIFRQRAVKRSHPADTTSDCTEPKRVKIDSETSSASASTRSVYEDSTAFDVTDSMMEEYHTADTSCSQFEVETSRRGRRCRAVPRRMRTRIYESQGQKVWELSLMFE